MAGYADAHSGCHAGSGGCQLGMEPANQSGRLFDLLVMAFTHWSCLTYGMLHPHHTRVLAGRRARVFGFLLVPHTEYGCVTSSQDTLEHVG